MKQTLTTDQVFDLIRGERRYQDSRWHEGTTTTGGNHSFEEWILYIEHYLAKAKVVLATGAKQDADPIAADNLRKVAALAVAALENNGGPARA